MSKSLNDRSIKISKKPIKPVSAKEIKALEPAKAKRLAPLKSSFFGKP